MPEPATPDYELHARNSARNGLELTLWQMPCAATPHIASPLRLAGLKGRNLSLAEGSIWKILRHSGITVAPRPGETQKFPLDEDRAMSLGLLCKLLAPMRNAERMRQAALGLEEMRRSETAYWLGMAMHRKNPRRVLCALRMLLTG